MKTSLDLVPLPVETLQTSVPILVEAFVPVPVEPRFTSVPVPVETSHTSVPVLVETSFTSVSSAMDSLEIPTLNYHPLVFQSPEKDPNSPFQ